MAAATAALDRISALHPAAIETDILRQMSPVHVRYMLSKIPLNRPGTVAGVAALVACLRTEECSFSSGAVFDLSGGRASY